MKIIILFKANVSGIYYFQKVVVMKLYYKKYLSSLFLCGLFLVLLGCNEGSSTVNSLNLKATSSLSFQSFNEPVAANPQFLITQPGNVFMCSIDSPYKCSPTAYSNSTLGISANYDYLYPNALTDTFYTIDNGGGPSTIYSCVLLGSKCVPGNGETPLEPNAIAVDPNHKYIYVADFANNYAIWSCPIDQQNGLLANSCSIIYQGFGTNKITVSNNGIVYLAGALGNGIQYCKLSNGQFQGCNQTTSFTANGSSVALSDDGSTAYVADPNYNNYVETCTVENNGDLQNCTPNNVLTEFTQAIAQFQGNMYLSDGNITYRCKVNNDHSLNCANAVQWNIGTYNGNGITFVNYSLQPCSL